MEVMKIIFTIAIFMALTITLTMKNIEDREEEKPPFKLINTSEKFIITPSKRISRFLAEEKNPRAADHCNKDNEICSIKKGQNSTTCCNNKCMESSLLKTDKHNCGACKKKCKYTEACCRGECVNLSYDKRHCGECNNRCMVGGYCIYGLCDYA